MTTITTITTIVNLLGNPLVKIGAPLLLTLALALAAYAIKTQPKVADVAQDLADLAEEVEPWVIWAEDNFKAGDHKYSAVLDKAEAWMKSSGITGQRGRVVKKYLPALIEAAVKKVDPKLAPKKAA